MFSLTGIPYGRPIIPAPYTAASPRGLTCDSTSTHQVRTGSAGYRVRARGLVAHVRSI